MMILEVEPPKEISLQNDSPSIVTVCEAAIITLLVLSGTIPPTQVAGSVQFPVLAEVICA